MREDGQDLVEYALIAALLSLAAVASMTTLAGSIKGVFDTINTSLTAA
jgi:pilus assembly protein Flp/PilA